jgi:hypothetical protein
MRPLNAEGPSLAAISPPPGLLGFKAKAASGDSQPDTPLSGWPALGMTNTTRRSLLSARGGLFGGRLNASLRVYSLGGGGDAHLYFSLKLWQAAVARQQRLGGLLPA